MRKKIIKDGEVDISPGSKGDLSELLVCIDLMKKGYEVYRAVSPASYCDLLAIKGEEIKKIEVRTGFYYESVKGDKRLQYPKKRTENKEVIVVTYSDNKLHYI